MTRSSLLAPLVLLALAAPAGAQVIDHRSFNTPTGEDAAAFFARLTDGTPVEGRPGLVWRHVGIGWTWDAAPVTDAPFVPSEATCRLVNPYTEPDAAIACLVWRRGDRVPDTTLPTFRVGASYVHPYPHIRMTVLSVALALDAMPVVTAQYTAGETTGRVFAFRVDQAAPWREEP